MIFTLSKLLVAAIDGRYHEQIVLSHFAKANTYLCTYVNVNATLIPIDILVTLRFLLLLRSFLLPVRKSFHFSFPFSFSLFSNLQWHEIVSFLHFCRFKDTASQSFLQAPDMFPLHIQSYNRQRSDICSMVSLSLFFSFLLFFSKNLSETFERNFCRGQRIVLKAVQDSNERE